MCFRRSERPGFERKGRGRRTFPRGRRLAGEGESESRDRYRDRDRARAEKERERERESE